MPKNSPRVGVWLKKYARFGQVVKKHTTKPIWSSPNEHYLMDGLKNANSLNELITERISFSIYEQLSFLMTSSKTKRAWKVT